MFSLSLIHILNEIIREKILLYYDKEIPYSVEVVVEQFKEEEKKIHINEMCIRDRCNGIRALDRETNKSIR